MDIIIPLRFFIQQTQSIIKFEGDCGAGSSFHGNRGGDCDSMSDPQSLPLRLSIKPTGRRQRGWYLRNCLEASSDGNWRLPSLQVSISENRRNEGNLQTSGSVLYCRRVGEGGFVQICRDVLVLSFNPFPFQAVVSGFAPCGRNHAGFRDGQAVDFHHPAAALLPERGGWLILSGEVSGALFRYFPLSLARWIAGKWWPRSLSRRGRGVGFRLLLFLSVQMGSLLKEALRHLCAGGGWSYAVFWKIGRRSPTLLVWGDGYYDTTKHLGLSDVSEIGSTELILKEWEALWNTSGERFGQLKTPAEDPVLKLVNKIMMHQVHIGGEGIVGRVAFTGIHQWIMPETQMSSQAISEDEEVRLQVLAGMQTIAVIPVVPHGVVQFGSKNKVMENVRFVNQVKSLFAELGSLGACLSTSDQKMALIPKNLNPSSVGMCASTDQSANGTFHMSSSIPFVNGFRQQIQSSGNDNQLSNVLLNQNNASASFVRTICNGGFSSGHPVEQPSEKEAIRAQIKTSNAIMHFSQPVSQNSCSNNNAPSGSLAGSPSLRLKVDTAVNYQQQSTSAALLERGALYSTGKNVGNQSSFPCEMWRPVDGNPSFSSGISAGPPDLGIPPLPKTQTKSCTHEIADSDLLCAFGTLSSNSGENNSWVQAPVAALDDCQTTYSLPGEGIQISESTVSEVDATQTLSKTLNPSLEGDLFDLLGLEFKMEKYSGNLNDVVVQEDKKENWSSDVSTHITQPDRAHTGTVEDTLISEMSESGIFAESRSDHLLDAIVSKVNFTAKQNSDDNVSCKTNITRTSSCCLLDNPSAYSKESFREKPKGRELFGLPNALIKPEIAELGSFKSTLIREKPGDISQANGMYKSQINLWVEDRQSMKHDSISTGNSKKANETVKLNRKRPRPGDSPRPRPKDRQMIQDRVKDLREIIPNGAKCSIDALLERTIKHMLFLQSVSKHADKLKQTGDSKIINKEGGLLLKDNYEGGATWAFEVGSQSMVCPIIVENLNGPRQMLVEMLCQERGFFLEIADIIRGLGLTILKGVMESRNDTIWARFAVEANRDVSRRDVFMSLVRLLDQNTKDRGTLKVNDSGSMGVSMFNKSSIPVTGSSIAATGLIDGLC
ncbi:hypothetical protein H6P81_015772 [Aristolochia fimbriata]|uniref:BHLH domain-containing protein n=1 Tax=Aristolochia fimbriata TaxID=158543 RepID=A0AAV7EA78_ARIFI|nr:hypothetical protein H6P81_015772 [Aristolochia fimbriata]